MFPLFLKLDQNEPYINTFQTIIRNVCLSIIFEFYLLLSVFCCLWSVVCCLLSVVCDLLFVICCPLSVRCLLSVVCSTSAAYTNLYRGLKYLLEVRCIILVFDFWLSRLFVWAVKKYCPMSENNFSKMNGICVW